MAGAGAQPARVKLPASPLGVVPEAALLVAHYRVADSGLVAGVMLVANQLSGDRLTRWLAQLRRRDRCGQYCPGIRDAGQGQSSDRREGAQPESQAAVCERRQLACGPEDIELHQHPPLSMGTAAASRFRHLAHKDSWIGGERLLRFVGYGSPSGLTSVGRGVYLTHERSPSLSLEVDR